MVLSASDFTEYVVAARSNEPRVVEAFGRQFPSARFHLPLETLDGVRNRPETATELGARLPVHWLRLDSGERAAPVFTSLALCRECAERLDWTTDGRTIKSLRVPGDVALAYLAQVLLSPNVERAILNPLSDAELHLARTGAEAMASGKPFRSLWYYDRNGRLQRPVGIVGASSLLGSLLSEADRMLGAFAPPAPELPPIPLPAHDAMEALEHIESRGPFGALASELYRIVSGEHIGRLEIQVTKSGGNVEVEASPRPTDALLARLQHAAERALEGEPGDARLTFRCDETSVVLSTSSSSKSTGPPPPPLPSRSSPRPLFDYIPLEPEESD